MPPWEVEHLLTSGQRLRIYTADLGRFVECTLYESERPEDWNAFTIETADDNPDTPGYGYMYAIRRDDPTLIVAVA